MRHFLFLTTLLVAGIADASADANDRACSILNDAVYRQVIGAGRSDRGFGEPPIAKGGPLVCTNTAHAVSAGFSRAMAELNIYLTWPAGDAFRRYICLTVDLSQCIPSQDPYVPPLSLGDAALVLQRWNAVKASVAAMMPAGTASDVARFDPVAVGPRLARDLGRVRDPATPLY